MSNKVHSTARHIGDPDVITILEVADAIESANFEEAIQQPEFVYCVNFTLLASHISYINIAIKFYSILSCLTKNKRLCTIYFHGKEVIYGISLWQYKHEIFRTFWTPSWSLYERNYRKTIHDMVLADRRLKWTWFEQTNLTIWRNRKKLLTTNTWLTNTNKRERPPSKRGCSDRICSDRCCLWPCTY